MIIDADAADFGELCGVAGIDLAQQGITLAIEGLVIAAPFAADAEGGRCGAALVGVSS